MPPAAPDKDLVPFITLPNWVKAAAQCGFNIQPIFRELGVQTDLVHVESATIERERLERVMDECVARSKRQHFPFVLGETFAFEYLPDLETFLTTSSTLREAVRVFDWVRELINPMIDVRLEEKGDLAILVVDLSGGGREGRAAPYFPESMFAAIQKFSRMLLGDRPRFERLCFRHAAPPYRKAYETFFDAPLKFRQPRYTLEMKRSILDQPLGGGFPALHEQAQYRVEQRLSRLLKRPGLVAAIEDAFSRRPQLLGQGIDQMAAELKLHSRTLQRRLREEGHSYGDVQGRVRYRMALQMLERDGEAIEDISERLGFSDRRSFTRAFKRWSGVSPRSFQSRGGQ